MFKKIHFKKHSWALVWRLRAAAELPLLSSCNIITQRYRDTGATIQMQPLNFVTTSGFYFGPCF